MIPQETLDLVKQVVVLMLNSCIKSLLNYFLQIQGYICKEGVLLLPVLSWGSQPPTVIVVPTTLYNSEYTLSFNSKFNF